jgi:c-di-GMP-binding flagellar brake protein YcgR
MLDKLQEILYQRRHARVMVDAAAPIKLSICAKGQQFKTIAWDVSEGGVGFKLPAALSEADIGCSVSIRMSLPYPTPQDVSTIAELRHVTDLVHGVSFKKMDEASLAIVAEYVAYMKENKPTLVTRGKKPALEPMGLH